LAVTVVGLAVVSSHAQQPGLRPGSWSWLA
jgi:hypothetical protein